MRFDVITLFAEMFPPLRIMGLRLALKSAGFGL